MPTAEASPKLNDSARRALVVAGMHRSGTSAMTRVLSLLGAGLPKRLMSAHPCNEKGFWETQSVADLNDEILDTLDSGWDDVFAFRPRPYLSNFDRFYRGRAVEVLEEAFNGSELVVLKDPRISVLASFWEHALREAGYATHYIFMVRNPLEVAESLRARDEFPREKSLLLWSSYMIAADRDTRDHPRTFVSYDQLMDDWRSVRRRVEQSVGIPLPRDSAAAANEIDRFLDRELRHHRVPAEDLYSRSDVTEEIKTLYRIFADACEGADVDRAAVDAIQAELAKMDALVGPLLADFRGRVRTLDKDLKELKDAHSESSRLADAMAEELAAERALRESEAEAASALAKEKEEKLTELAERLAAAEADHQEKARQLDELTAKIAAAERRAEKAEAQRQRLLKEAEGKQQQIDQLEAEVEAERERVLQRASDLKATRRELETMRTNLTATEARLSDERVRLEDEMERLKDRFTTDLRRARSERDDAQSIARASEVKLSERYQQFIEVLKQQELQNERALADLEFVVALNERMTSRPRWWSLMPQSWRWRRERRRLERAGLFDGAAYLESYPDVVAEGMDPLQHFVRHGISEGRRRSF